MHVEFEQLEQRPGSHTVPVRMTREELETCAEKMADLNSRIENKEDDLRRYSKEIRDDIKDLEVERHAATSVYRFKRDPKLTEGLWGFEFENHGRVRCKVCVERSEKKDEPASAVIGQFDTTELLLEVHEEFEWADGEKHPAIPVWERPLGTKWFVDPKSGDVFGPVAVTEKDLNRELFPETKEFQPFQLTFDADTAVPLLDAVQHSAAEKKLRETEAAEPARTSVDESTHEECGLPIAWHPQVLSICNSCNEEHEGRVTGSCPSCGDDALVTVTGEGEAERLRNGERYSSVKGLSDRESPLDACKEAMKRGADEAQKAQSDRTSEKYSGDIVLDPEAAYPCGKCNVATFGRDLQAVTIDGKTQHVCFACEQEVPTGDQAAPEQPAKPKRKATKKKKKE